MSSQYWYAEWIEGIYAREELAEEICSRLRQKGFSTNAPAWCPHERCKFTVKEHLVRL